MRRYLEPAAIVGGATLALWLATPARPAGQVARQPLTVAAQTVDSLRQWDGAVDVMLRSGGLRVRRRQDDTLLAGRTHERMDQMYRGVRIFGADLTRQIQGAQTVSIFGVLYQDVSVDVTARLDTSQGQAAIETLAGTSLRAGRTAELVILPTPAGTYVLTYTAELWTGQGPTVYFVDASSGAEVWRYSNLQTQSAVRTGRGVLGDAKKVSMKPSAGTYFADDQLRPPALLTFDMREDLNRTISFLNGAIPLLTSDLATSSADPWLDGMAVDAHVYQGWTYDYYLKRFGRRGLDDNNIRIVGLVHTVRQDDVFRYPPDVQFRFFVNAFYAGDGVMVYGEGLPGTVTLNGQRYNYFAGALDIVGHELTHGVTSVTSQLIYANESGALNEAFSDIIGTSIEFFFQSVRGRGGNYLLGEDIATPGGNRSMADPRAFGDPDNYSIRFTGTDDNGGVHINSGIANNAFYLAIEGGRNRTSGLPVAGVGPGNRDQIEKSFYRAFVSLMPSNSTFAVARRTTIQAAQDLYGSGSAAATAITQAWTAVGVN